MRRALQRSVVAIVAAAATTMACSLLSGAADLSIEADDASIIDDHAVGEGSVPPGPPPIDGGSDANVAPDAQRVTTGILALYTFAETTGATVHDVSGIPPALDLTIQPDGGAAFAPTGLTITTTSYVTSPGPATKIITACQASNEITLEAWATPSNTTQSPARICGIGGGNGDPDVTIDAAGKQYQGYLRTGSALGQYSILHTTGTTVTLSRTHVVMTRKSDNNRYLYLDGVEVSHDAPTTTAFSTWNAAHPFTVGNGSTLDLAWLGTVHLVAVYGRALTAAEVAQNFTAGP